MTDISGGTGGQRNSRSARSRSTQLDTGRVSVRSQDRARAVHVAGRGKAQGVDAVAQAIGSFAPFLEQAAAQSEEKELADIREENREEITRVKSAVLQDRQGALDAVRTGDHSKFIPSNEFRSRKVIANSFEDFTARHGAQEDKETIRERIFSGGPAAVPERELEAYIAEQTKGGSPVFKAAFADEATRVAQPFMTEFRNTRQAVLAHEAELQAEAVVRNSLVNGDVPPTLGALDTMTDKIASTLPIPGPEQRLRAEAIRDKIILDEAAKGNALALKIATLPDETRDGTSIRTRNEEAYQASVDKHVANARKTRSLEHHNALESLEDRMAMHDAGQTLEGDSMEAIGTDLAMIRQRYGDNEAFDVLRNKYLAMLGAKATQSVTFDQLALGNTLPDVSNAQWNKDAKLLLSPEGKQMLMDRGLTAAEADRVIFASIAKKGPGTEGRDIMSNRLMLSDDLDDVTGTFTFLDSVDKASDLDLVTGKHLTEKANRIFKLMQWGLKAQKDPLRVRSDFLKATNEGAEGDPEKHFESRVSGDGTQGSKGALKVAKEAWDILDEDILDLHPGFWGSLQGKPGFDNLPNDVQQAFIKAVNVSSYLLSGTSVDEGDIANMASSFLERRLGVEADVDGNLSITMDRTPSVVVDETGKLIAGQQVTKDIIDRALDRFESAEMTPVIQAIGEFGGLRQDDLTELGEGLAVRTSANGFPQDISIAPGAIFTVAADSVSSEQGFGDDISGGQGPLEGFLRMVETGVNESNDKDIITFAAPHGEFDGQRIDVNALGVFMVFHGPSGSWRMRYKDVPDDTEGLSLSELETNRRENVFEAPAREEQRMADIVASRRNQGEPKVKPFEVIDETLDAVSDVAKEAIGEAGEAVQSGARSVANSIRKFFTTKRPGGQDPRNRAASERQRAAERRNALKQGRIGTAKPPVTDEQRGPVSDDEISALIDQEKAVVENMSTRGIVDPKSAMDAQGDDVEELTEDAISKSQDAGGLLNDVAAPGNQQYFAELSTFIEQHEGRTSFAYDDHTAKPWADGAANKGDPTVGVGFNLNRPDARQMMEKIGVDLDDVKAGKVRLSRSQQDRLLSETLRETNNWLRSHFKGVTLRNHQWVALTSLAYNSRWSKSGPTLIGVKLTKAIREGDFVAAAHEIESNSAGGVPARLKPAIQARRAKEAMMFRGNG